MSTFKDEIKDIKNIHKTWHQFTKWIERKFGKDLMFEEEVEFPTDHGKTKKYTLKHIKQKEFNDRIHGYGVISAIEKYCKKHEDIKIVWCDDNVFAGSIIILVPHPTMGISVMFVPQCTDQQNVFFLYKNHFNDLLKTLKEMKWVYKNSIMG